MSYTDDIEKGIEGYNGYAHTMSDDPRQQKWRQQRDTYGCDDTCLYDLDYGIINFVYPKIKFAADKDTVFFIKTKHYYKGDYTKNKKKARKIIRDMEYGFRLYLTPDNSIDSATRDKIVNKAFKLFGKYFSGLWC